MSRLFCESNCELNYALVEEIGATVIGMPYTRNGEEGFFDMGKNAESMTEFFQGMSRGDAVVTNALNPQNYNDYFEPIFAMGEDVLYIHFSHQLSGTFDFMRKAVDSLLKKYPGRKFTAVDTLNISQGAGLIVYEAGKMHKAGASDEEIVSFVEKFRQSVRTTFLVDSLNHLKKGGRVSSTTAFFGTLLNIKPILYMTAEGKIEKLDKTNGRKKGVEFLLDNMAANASTDTLKYPIIILHADCIDDANALKSKLIERYGTDISVWICMIGPTIGTHCGPNTLGLIYVGTDK